MTTQRYVDSYLYDDAASAPLGHQDDILYSAIVATSGAQTIAGAKTFSTMPIWPVNSPAAAAGSNQGNAAALVTGITKITGADNTKGCVLPASAAGNVVILYNSDATHTLKVYPASGGAINAGSANAALTVTAACPVILIALDASNNWFSIPLLPS